MYRMGLCRTLGTFAVPEISLRRSRRREYPYRRRLVPRIGLALCLTGGDDYELAFAVPTDREAALREAAEAAAIPVTCIGAFVAGPPRVIVRDAEGAEMPLGAGGWSHFR